ncbi:MBL fold metallo-hydrolase [Phytoactinopolyspora alkaliphila]|uniref:MBL fold metallo-hydrolase n=1 Tax=Phytoactinopolyspora alkaliphila TaxID=1783498 RepID=A0A6N9YFN0_9ACTN|nr:MBL fold metallo-hydrolase [Phytoactinopolyspora alkaliphila]
MNAALTVIGARAGSPGPNGPGSGYLLSIGATAVLLDSGPGVLAGLLNHCSTDELDAVVISHQHADHTADLVPFGYHRSFPEPKPPLPLYGPEGIAGYVAALDQVHGIPTLEHMKAPIATYLPLTEVKPGASITVNDVVIDTIAAAHPVPAISMAVPSVGFVYTADTALTDELVELSRGARLLLAEATYPEPEGHDFDEHGHMSGHEAGQLAARAGVAHLVVTHMSDIEDAERTVRNAASHYGGPISVAVPGQRYRLG